MSPVDTPKFRLALEALAKLGLVPTAIQALADSGPDALYHELSRRGRVWSTDLKKWRKSMKPRAVPAVPTRSGYLDRASLRVIVHADEVDGAIDELHALAGLAGYELLRIDVREGRSIHECLIYTVLRQIGARNG